MEQCRYKRDDGSCAKHGNRRDILCKPSSIDWCDDSVEMINADEMCIFSSPWGNSCSFITEEQIEELKQGKVIYVDDGEYCHFIALKRDNNEVS